MPSSERPRCGVYTLISVDTQLRLPHEFKLQELLTDGDRITGIRARTKGGGTISATALIQSNFGTPGLGSLELAVRTVRPRVDLVLRADLRFRQHEDARAGAVHASSRYYLRTALVIALPLFGALAALTAMGQPSTAMSSVVALASSPATGGSLTLVTVTLTVAVSPGWCRSAST